MNKTRLVNQYNSVYIILMILCMAALIYQPGYMQTKNIYMMLRQASALGILTLGQLFVVSAGGVDLSVVAIMQVAATVFMYCSNTFGTLGIVVGILLSFVAGIAVGLVNGIIIAKYRVQPFLTTLFTGVIFVGIRRVLAGVAPMGVAPVSIMEIVKGEQPGAFPNAAVIFLMAAALVFVVFNFTIFGREVMSIGTNPTAALFSGIKIDRIKIATYCISAAAAVISAIILVGYTGYADQDALGKGMEFDSLVAVVLGGNFLGGGRASVMGAVGGVLVTTLLINIVILFGLKIQYQYVVKGLILLVVTFIASFVRKSS